MPADAFAMTKLVVGDLEGAKAFYGAVCGLKEAQRISGEVEGRKMTELVMSSEARGASTLVLYTWHDTPKPALGECVLVFQTSDIDAFLDRAEKAGGTVTQKPIHLPEHGLKYAFVQDLEGHVLEAIQRL